MAACSCGRDFLAFLGGDISLEILRCPDDSSDLVRASAVSTSWRRFVIESRLSRQLCLRLFPQLADVFRVETNVLFPRANDLMVEHIVYSSLAHRLSSSKQELQDILVSKAISASSTDHFYEAIENTLLPGDGRRTSYWSSKGESDPAVPETLTYNLVSDFCVITEIHLQPFEDPNEIEIGSPIYSSMEVRFRAGRSSFAFSKQKPSIDKLVWTYTSPVFPMKQRSSIQRFRLPEPVLCIGGILQIELLGRMIKHPFDGLYYICMSNVQASGANLSPKFNVTILDESGRFILKHDPRAADVTFCGSSDEALWHKVWSDHINCR